MILDGGNLDNNDNDDDNEFEEHPPRWHGEVVLHLLPLFVQPAALKSPIIQVGPTRLHFWCNWGTSLIIRAKSQTKAIGGKFYRIYPSRIKGQDLVWFKNSDFIYYIWLNQAET